MDGGRLRSGDSSSRAAALPLLSGLDPGAVAALLDRGTERRAGRGETLFRAGDPARGLFLIVEGRVRIVRETIGRGQVVHEEGPGGTLGEIPLFTGCPYPATATATESTRCLVFPLVAVRSAVAVDPELAFRLLGTLATRVRGLIDRLDRLVFAGVRARLAAWILERRRTAIGPVVSLGLSQERLAEELGTVREVVVRELRSLREAGVVRSKGAGRLEVIDPARLEAIASGSEAPSLRRRAPGGGRRDGRPRSGAR